MRMHTAVLVSIVIIVVSEWHRSEGYLARARVPVKNGKCQHNGTEVSPSEPLKLEHPCEEWSCHLETAEAGEVVLAGCGVVRPGPGCVTVKGTGVYPECCVKIVCN
ncbi:complement inhibitor CirpT4-like [Dermacentor variabilis]|uniref:complement inhibitor CirpT4-like n=1 Tax=Dermacentor variabilis TaxID=34621 RepID=UPI003F5C4B0E